MSRRRRGVPPYLQAKRFPHQNISKQKNEGSTGGVGADRRSIDGGKTFCRDKPWKKFFGDLLAV